MERRAHWSGSDGAVGSVRVLRVFAVRHASRSIVTTQLGNLYRRFNSDAMASCRWFGWMRIGCAEPRGRSSWRRVCLCIDTVNTLHSSTSLV